MRLDEPTGLDDKAPDASRGGTSTSPTAENSPKLKRYGHFLVKKPSAPYATPTAPAGHAGRVVQWLGDKQPVSAVKSAELVWQLGHCKYPPLRLLLGSFAIESVRDRLKSVTEEIEDWKYLSFPSAVGGAEEGDAKGKKDGEEESGGDGEDEEMGEGDGGEVEGVEVKEEEG
jgi:hypothetical protein